SVVLLFQVQRLLSARPAVDGWKAQAEPERATLLASLASATTLPLSTKAEIGASRKLRLPASSTLTVAASPGPSGSCWVAVPSTVSPASRAPLRLLSSKKATSNGPAAGAPPWLRITVETVPEITSVCQSPVTA